MLNQNEIIVSRLVSRPDIDTIDIRSRCAIGLELPSLGFVGFRTFPLTFRLAYVSLDTAKLKIKKQKNKNKKGGEEK